jgi:6,7-dimethyl-8-ribityllumazine synthase
LTARTHGDGELRPPEGVRLLAGAARPARLAIVASRYHSEVVQALLEGAVAEAVRRGVAADAIELVPVPGAFEVGLAAREAAASGRYDAVAVLACVIRGDTPHFDYVCSEAARGVLLASLETRVPIGFGVLTCETPEQAWARAGGGDGNKGAEAAAAALELASTLEALREPQT